MESRNPTLSANVSPAHLTATQPSQDAEDVDNPLSSITSNSLNSWCLEPTQIPATAKQPNNPSNDPLPQAFQVIQSDEDLLNAWDIVNWAFDMQSTLLPSTGKLFKQALASTCSLQAQASPQSRLLHRHAAYNTWLFACCLSSRKQCLVRLGGELGLLGAP